MSLLKWDVKAKGSELIANCEKWPVSRDPRYLPHFQNQSCISKQYQLSCSWNFIKIYFSSSCFRPFFIVASFRLSRTVFNLSVRACPDYENPRLNQLFVCSWFLLIWSLSKLLSNLLVERLYLVASVASFTLHLMMQFTAGISRTCS
jgi:hypothetical protein